MTNLERIHKMTADELIIFLKNCNFQNIYPVIEGQRFWSIVDIKKWLNKEVDENE